MRCECELAGYCDRHRIHKTDRMVHLCEHNDDYWEKWEIEKFGKPLEKQAVKPRRGGPGTELKKLIAAKGYQIKSQGCGCSDRAKQMDRWGVARCREKIDKIVKWLEESAAEAGWLERLAVSIPGINIVAKHEIKKLVNEAIDQAEKLASAKQRIKNDPE